MFIINRIFVIVASLIVIVLSHGAPKQIHISQADVIGSEMFVSYLASRIFPDAAVKFGLSPDTLNQLGFLTQTPFQYTYQSQYMDSTYTSDYIHHFLLTGLKPSTTYYYRCGTAALFSDVLNFTTNPPIGPNVPVVLGLIGDLGQTYDSATTVQHVLADSSIQLSLLVGDLSYADSGQKPRSNTPCSQERWDTWGKLVQPLTSSQALMVLPGNHEIESSGIDGFKDFLAFQSRFRTPSNASHATNGNLYYSFEVGSAHIVMLNSYMDFDENSDQYLWLKSDLEHTNRGITPWLIVAFHAPWYNSNILHHDEREETGMRASMEPLLLQYHVDLVFSGHVHAYERSVPVYQQTPTDGAPTYITIGDGGNREGTADDWYPTASWSAYHESAFGHGRLELLNSTHAHWSWQKNVDSVSVTGDNIWFVKSAKNNKKTTKVHQF